jgi:hypothetical protein
MFGFCVRMVTGGGAVGEAAAAGPAVARPIGRIPAMIAEAPRASRRHRAARHLRAAAGRRRAADALHDRVPGLADPVSVLPAALLVTAVLLVGAIDISLVLSGSNW